MKTDDMKSNEKKEAVWRAKVIGLWFTIVFLLFIAMAHALIVVRAFETFDKENIAHYFLSLVPVVVFGFLGLFAVTYTRIAVRIEMAGGYLLANGLFGQKWRIPLSEIERLKNADIFLIGRKRPVLQIGVLHGGMSSFIAALKASAPNLKNVEIEDLQKQGRY